MNCTCSSASEFNRVPSQKMRHFYHFFRPSPPENENTSCIFGSIFLISVPYQSVGEQQTPQIVCITKSHQTPMALIRCAVLVASWLALATSLPVPRTVRSVDGSLDITLTLERASITLSNGVTLNTRAYNKTVPGPTLRMKAGDTLRVLFQNLLPDQGSSYVHNQFSAADESNVHFHGLHVSGELPSDDSTVPVLPGVLLIEHENMNVLLIFG